jgi:Family of unknown function (DUF5681)
MPTLWFFPASKTDNRNEHPGAGPMEDDRNEDDQGDEGVGYRRPPKSTRYAKGRSGNPAGRPRGRHSQAPYEGLLGQIVGIREGGITRRVTAEIAFLLQLGKRGIEGGGAPAREALQLIEEVKSKQPAYDVSLVVLVAVGRVTSTLQMLRMATKLDPLRKTARWALEPWLVEAALARLPEQLTPDEQRVVLKATRTPQKVRWPQWWSEFP